MKLQEERAKIKAAGDFKKFILIFFCFTSLKNMGSCNESGNLCLTSTKSIFTGILSGSRFIQK